jgi:hypothetical protein
MSAQAVDSPETAREASVPTPANKTRLPASVTVKKGILEPLATEFNHDGFHYCQIARQGMVAIYSQRDNRVKNPSTAYEVVKIQQRPDREIAGKLIPAHEAMPGSEQWGQKGWTYASEDRARAKFKELT